MHRIPLQLPEPTISWDRTMPEDVLFERTLNKKNVEETDKFVTILEQETDNYFQFSYNHAGDQFAKVPLLLNNKNPAGIEEGMRLLNGIILRAPRDSPVLPFAIILRGKCSFQNCCFDAACADYEMFLYVGSPTNDTEILCEVNGSLVICYYLMSQYEQAKKRLETYLNYKALLPADYIEIPSLKRISRHISEFICELVHVEDTAPKCVENVYFSTPFKGFNISEDIPLSSAACTYIRKTNGTKYINGVYGNCTIPSGSSVLVEFPIEQSVDKPFLHCEQCLRKKKQMYSCLDCRFKTYCSLKCMQKDAHVHISECIVLLSEKVFTSKRYRKLRTASAVWEVLQSVGDEQNIHGMQYLQLLRKKPDYCRLTNIQYSTMVVTAFRLTIFIEKKTSIMESFYGKLRLSNKQKMIVIGSILMRLNCHLLNNSFDFEFVVPLTSEKDHRTIRQQVEELAAGLKPISDDIVEDIYGYYNIDSENAIEERLLTFLQANDKEKTNVHVIRQTNSCSRIERHMSTYKDNVAELYFYPEKENFFINAKTAKMSASLISSHIREMDDKERYLFVQSFARHFHAHFVEYFLQMNLRCESMTQVLTLLCPSLSKFRHSCSPNVQVILLEDGLVVGKVLREIKQGEEICIAFKTQCMQHTLVERRDFLQKLNVECSCKYCEMDEYEDVCNKRLGIFCDACENIKITPYQEKCSKCRKSYTTLLARYQAESKLISSEINKQLQKKGNERDLFIHYAMYYKHACRRFVASNEFRIQIELEYVKFLALKNFARQACDIIIDVRKRLILNYRESLIWFTLYSDILNEIKVILYYNLEDVLYSVPNGILNFMCKFGLCIINGQLNNLKLYETFDRECSSMLHDLSLFMEWWDQIPCIRFLPVCSNYSVKSKKKTKDCEEIDDELMPSLSLSNA